MAPTKAEIRQKLLDWLNQHENIKGMDTCPLIAEFVEQEKLCPEVVEDIVSDLAANYTRLSGGRMLIPYETQRAKFSERFSNELLAHHTFHTGGIRCPRK